MSAKQKAGPARAVKASKPTEAINRHLGLRVRQLRSERGWSLEALASARGGATAAPVVPLTTAVQ